MAASAETSPGSSNAAKTFVIVSTVFVLIVLFYIVYCNSEEEVNMMASKAIIYLLETFKIETSDRNKIFCFAYLVLVLFVILILVYQILESCRSNRGRVSAGGSEA